MNAPFLASLALALSAGLALVIAPQEPAATQVDPHRQFDFWIGSWECYTATNQLAGTNEITLDHGNKVLQEHWKGTGGGTGTSLNMYDAARGVWHQTWCDGSGMLLLLDGGLTADGVMRLEGTRPKPGGGEVLHRVEWTPKDDTVRQVWTTTADGGATWSTLADLVYRPVEERAAAPGDK